MSEINNETSTVNESAETTAEKHFCRKCGAELTGNSPFCPKCGTPVKRICAKCQTVLADEQDYCPNCGTRYSDGIKAIDIKNSSKSVGGFIQSKKKTIITIGIICIVLFGGFFVFRKITRPNFNKLLNDFYKIENDKVEDEESSFTMVLRDGILGEPAAVKVGSDGSWLKIDTNPKDVDSDDRNSTASIGYYYATNTLIEYLNEQLGFSDIVKDDMQETTSLMGVQTAESDKATVKWTYHPDKGLEVTYTLK